MILNYKNIAFYSRYSQNEVSFLHLHSIKDKNWWSLKSLFLMKTLYSKPYFPLFNQSSYFFVDWFKIIVSSRERLFYCYFFLTFGIHCDGIKLIILPFSVNYRFCCALSWQNQIWITFFGWKTNLTISSKMLFIRRDFVGQTIYRAQHWLG